MTKPTTIRKCETDGKRATFDILKFGHVPYNKHSWKVHECRAVLEVEDYNGSLHAHPNPWISIQLREIESYESGRTTERVISLTLDAEQRSQLLALLIKNMQVSA